MAPWLIAYAVGAVCFVIIAGAACHEEGVTPDLVDLIICTIIWPIVVLFVFGVVLIRDRH